MKSRPGTVKLTVKLTRDELAALEALATREGLDWGGLPSKVAAIRWLIAGLVAPRQCPGDEVLQGRRP